ncbi:MAG: hypothetical protein LBL75_02270 [Rickettsiales bacterium]|jgi:hypothetical protein|nr:hypothetical protein [Rickettsiales bacterium]
MKTNGEQIAQVMEIIKHADLYKISYYSRPTPSKKTHIVEEVYTIESRNEFFEIKAYEYSYFIKNNSDLKFLSRYQVNLFGADETLLGSFYGANAKKVYISLCNAKKHTAKYIKELRATLAIQNRKRRLDNPRS